MKTYYQSRYNFYINLRNRQQMMGSILDIYFDDEDYNHLRRFAREIINDVSGYEPMKDSNYDINNQMNNRGHICLPLLAYASEYVRRCKPTTDNIFWDGFYNNLDYRNKTKQNMCAEILWDAYKLDGIPQKWGDSNRLIVMSLIDVLSSPEAKRQSFVDFFCWYYQYYDKKKIIDHNTIQEYIQFTKNNSSIIPKLQVQEKAFPLLNQDIKKLTAIIDAIREKGIKLDHQSPETYREYIIKAVGSEYDIKDIFFIREDKQLQKVFQQLEEYIIPIDQNKTQVTKNYKNISHSSQIRAPQQPKNSSNQSQKHIIFSYTPQTQNHLSSDNLASPSENNVIRPDFKDILQNTDPNARVDTPDREGIHVYQFLKDWHNYPSIYGIYHINNKKYHVVPLANITLHAINEWPLKKLITNLPNGFVGYKKATLFQIKSGQQLIKPDYFHFGNRSLYIWVGQVPIDKTLIIDGRTVPQPDKILEYKPSLHISINDDKITFQLVFDTLEAYYPNSPHKEITIKGTEDQLWSAHLDHQGKIKRSRAIVLPLPSITESTTLDFYINGQKQKSYQFKPETAYLFSRRTSVRIPPGNKKDWGEHRYLLLAPPSATIKYDPNIVQIEQSEIEHNHFNVYDVTWENDKQSFNLQVDNLSWTIRQQVFISLQNAPQVIGPFHLARHQIFSFSQSSLTIYSTISLKNTSMPCQVIYNNKTILETDLQHAVQKTRNSHIYQFSSGFLSQLDMYSKQKKYGHYNILLLDEERKLLDSITLALLPQPVIASSPRTLTIEGQPWEVSFTSPDIPLWDHNQRKESSTSTYTFFPRLQSSFTGENLPKGIVPLKAESIQKLLVFPSLGETLEIQLKPELFGVRLYQKSFIGQSYTEPYQAVEMLDYYALEHTVLMVNTSANTSVYFRLQDKNKVLLDKVNQDDRLIKRNFSFLRNHIKREITPITIICQDQAISLKIYWRPQILSSSFKEGLFQATIQGPPTTGIELALCTIHHEVIATYHFPCNGSSEQHISQDISSTIPKDGRPYYLIAYCVFGDGTKRMVAQQWRIEPMENKLLTMLAESLSLGIGLSDESLLPALIEHISRDQHHNTLQ